MTSWYHKNRKKNLEDTRRRRRYYKKMAIVYYVKCGNCSKTIRITSAVRKTGMCIKCRPVFYFNSRKNLKKGHSKGSVARWRSYRRKVVG